MQTRGRIDDNLIRRRMKWQKIFSRRDMIPNYAAAKFAKDARRKARKCTLVIQVPDNKADLVKLAAA